MINARLGVLIVTLVCAMRPAYAQSESAQAEALFRQGRELLAAGKTAEACAAFESSQRLQGAVTTLLNLGGCREKNGQVASAWGAFVEAQRLLRDKTDENSVQLAKIAATRAANLEPRVSKLTIKVDNRIAGLEIRRGSDLVDAGTWNTSLPTDGGTYTLTARAPGHDEWTTTVTLANEHDDKTVTVPALVETKVVPTPESPTPEPPVPATTSTPSRIPSYALAGTSGALLVGALVFELWGHSKYSDAEAAGNDGDAMRANDLWHQANTRRYVAEGMLGAGVVAGGLAVYLFLHARQPEVAPVAHLGRVRLTPVVTTSSVGIMGEL